MESTSKKVDVIKPFFLKAGIPLAITAVGFVFARITRRKGSNLKASTAENHLNFHGKDRGEDCFHDLESVDSSSLFCLEEADHPSIETSQQYSEKEEELEAKSDIIRKLEDRIQEQQTALRWLQMEKNDMSSQIELAHKAASSKIDIEKADREDYSRVVSKLEKVENERAMEIKELIYLRWCNACLRHELMRKNQEEQDSKQYKNQTGLKFGEIANVGSNNELGHSTLDNGDSCLNFPTTSRGRARAHSKRKKFIEKLKRWVEGNEKTKQELNEKDNHETKHFGPDELHVHARKSYSSA